jgi:D-threo-aldose 1-dehydrogenase
LRASVLGLGGCGLGDIYGEIRESDAVDTVLRSLELGVTMIDTSPNYGNGKSEQRIGTALTCFRGTVGQTESGTTERLTLVTKCGDAGPQNDGHSPFSKEGVFASFKRSQALLSPGKVGVLLLHDPTLKELDEFFHPGTGGVEAFKELKQSGEVDATGVGVREHDVLFRFMTNPSNVADVVLPVNDWNLLRRYASVNILPLANKLGICVLNGGPLYMGLLSGICPQESFSQGSLKSGIEVPELVSLAGHMREWCNANEVDLRGLALRFAMGMWKVDAPGSDELEISYGIRSPQGFSPPIAAALVGAKSASEIEETVQSVVVALEEEDMYQRKAVEFEQAFGLAVGALADDAHWYYSKDAVDL